MKEKKTKTKSQGSGMKELDSLLKAISRELPERKMVILEDIFEAAIKLSRENPGTLNLKIAATALKELRYSFKMFSPHRLKPKITLFGSARVSEKEPLYRLAKDFAMEATRRNYMIITGGGPGVMAAGNEGAGPQSSFGLNIRLPFEQTPNPFIDKERGLIHYKYFFTRKLFLIKEASAFVLFPGGYGTLDESFELLTLLQTGKTNLIPMVLLEPKGFGFWKGFSEFLVKEMLGRGFISEVDRSFFAVLNTPEEALEYIGQYYKNYHSMRMVKERLVLRHKKVLSSDHLSRLNQKFGFLSMDGKFEVSGPLEEESNEPEFSDLPRLVFKFDYKDFGGLRLLIDYLNLA